MIVASIKATFGDVDIAKMRASDFLNIYLPNVHQDTPFGNILRIMTSKLENLTEEEKKYRKQREKQLNKNKEVRSANEFNMFARKAFGGKEAKK